MNLEKEETWMIPTSLSYNRILLCVLSCVFCMLICGFKVFLVYCIVFLIAYLLFVILVNTDVITSVVKLIAHSPVGKLV